MLSSSTDLAVGGRLARTVLVLAVIATAVFGSTASAQAQTEWDFAPGSVVSTFHQPVASGATGNPLVPATQAGGHADLTTAFTFTTVLEPIRNIQVPVEQLDDVAIDLPVGFYGDPGATPTCSRADFGQTIRPGGNCKAETQVGYVEITLGTNAGSIQRLPVYNLPAIEGETAVLGFTALNFVPVKIHITPRTDGDYGLQARVENTNQGMNVYAVKLTIWGVPADPVHDHQRFPGGGASPPGTPSTATPKPFLTLPPSCGETLKTTFRAQSWQQPNRTITATADSPAATGCDQLDFEPTIDVKPEVLTPDTPSGYAVDLKVPQTNDPAVLSTALLDDAKVVMPEGVTIAPPSAIGLEACADGKTNIGTRLEPDCPAASKIGTLEITTPLLDEDLAGEIILREPKPNNLFRLMLVARGSGMILKIPGDVRPDPKTGQLTAVFENAPQLPFSEMRLRFKGGSRAPLSNPTTCGTKTTTTELSSLAGITANPTSSFEITGCPAGGRPFAPSFTAGTLNPFAGGFSPFTMTFGRADGHQDLGAISLDMPSGLLGTVKGVPQCPEAQAAAGTCSEATRVGSTTVSAGSGETPFTLPGKVFFAGPYKGAPFSLSVVVRAIAGPFDLGTVVVRAPINVDAANAKLGVPSDPLPTILEGVPLRLRTVNITIDRPGFMFNATNCDAMAIGATITSTAGAVSKPAVPYQARGCASLPLEPRLELTMRGAKEVKDGKHPGLDASLTQAPGESGLKKVSVTLPLSLALESTNAQALCKPQEAAARACPAGSIVGRATAITPALNQPLTGPIYFVENTRVTASGNVRRTLPKLWLALRGEVPLDLWAESEIEKDHLVATFSSIPDAPISGFSLSIAGGEHGILAATQSICEKAQIAAVTFEGQNGKRVSKDISMGSECGYRVAKATRSKTSVTLTVSGLGAGKLEVSGKGLRKSSRTIKRATIARATAKLSKSALRTIRRSGRFSTRVTVKFTPAGGGKPRTTGAKVTFKR